MAAPAEKPPLALALLLLVAGLAALVTAVLLVWTRFEVNAPVAPVPPVPASEPAAVAAPSPGPGPGPAPPAAPVASPATVPAPAAADAGAPATAAETGAGATAGDGTWRLTLDPRKYSTDAAGDAAIAEIAAYLAGDQAAKVRLLGVNSTRLSEKRALQGARAVRDRLVAAGVDRRRCEVAADQEAGLEGLEVRVEMKGGAR